MIYIINGKPYIKVGNYYKPVKIEKKNNEYNVKPINSEDKSNRITMQDVKSKKLMVTSDSVENYMNGNTQKNKNNIDNM